MSKMKYTPWTARPSADSDGLWTVEDSRGAVVFFGMDEGVAHIFAAAPDLLAALKEAMPAAIFAANAHESFAMSGAVDRIRAAIAKAEGRQP